MHASSYKDPAQLRGKRVLVVGAGNTGCDIAVEAAQQASRCWHSTRRGYWYAPKYVLGRPADQVNDSLLALRVPLRVRQWLYHWTLRLTVGDLTRFGLPKPDHRVYETHPIANSQLVYYVGHGGIGPVPDVARFHPYAVELADGRGSTPSWSSSPPATCRASSSSTRRCSATSAGAGRPTLWLNAFTPGHPTLAVAGLLQPDSGLFTLSHWQTVLFARLLQAASGPTRNGPPRSRRRVRDRAGERYSGPVKDSSRHWFEVGHADYLRAIQRALVELEGK